MTHLFAKRTQNLLVDSDIVALVNSGRLFRGGFDAAFLGSVAYDLRADTSIASRNRTRTFVVSPQQEFVIEPGEVVTIETIEDLDFTDPLMVGLILTNHTQASVGLFHPTTSVDAGFQGHLSITLTNQGNTGYPIQPGQRIAKLLFIPVAPTPDRLYGSGQLPRVRQGSLEHALVLERRDPTDDVEIGQFLGGPMEGLVRRVTELEANMQVHSERQSLKNYRTVAKGTAVVVLGAAGSVLATYWQTLVDWFLALFGSGR